MVDIDKIYNSYFDLLIYYFQGSFSVPLYGITEDLNGNLSRLNLETHGAHIKVNSKIIYKDKKFFRLELEFYKYKENVEIFVSSTIYLKEQINRFEKKLKKTVWDLLINNNEDYWVKNQHETYMNNFFSNLKLPITNNKN